MSRSLFFISFFFLLWCVGCGGNGNSAPTGNNMITGAAKNVATLTANGGPANVVNGLFTSVTVCSPGSTTNCATINGILVDTGSTGLRIQAAALPSGFTLPQVNDAGGNPLAECFQFADGETWGPVQTADVTVSGETAAKTPLQVIGVANFPGVPAGCSNLGPTEQTVAAFGANGVLGLNNSPQDCGSACAAVANNPNVYYSCPASGCAVIAQGISQQVPNPVTLFGTDNNGVIIELPAIGATGAPSATGSLVFGIGTESNNGLGNATLLGTDTFGDFTAVFNGMTLNPAFLDTGSNGLFFDNTTASNLTACSGNTSFFCPGSTVAFSATNQGVNGATSKVNFSVANANNLFATNNAIFNDLGGSNPNTFDFGLPFFFGRNVAFAISGATTPAGVGPFVAY